MKFQVTMKDPDTLYESIEDAVYAQVASIPGMSAAEREAVTELRKSEIRKVTSRWFKYGEYLTVEIDTEDDTIKVLPANVE